MYYRTIPTNLNVADITLLITGEEAGGSKFVENKVTFLKTSASKSGAVKNMAKFIELDDSIPPPPVVIVNGDAAPAGKALQWTGPMLVKGTMTIVELYR
ncbi:hypothetical protein [Tahibacter soli]|uniref:Uncharacterized protein n=1 Tax=Tahibacter soli TaxID=2983605 RepID=A0A9X3YH26_9GAMM|nr:hypothetical protein [Tahibacter soli]MDC8011020.1 hypothetical protein [Tahibacter soli]